MYMRKWDPQDIQVDLKSCTLTFFYFHIIFRFVLPQIISVLRHCPPVTVSYVDSHTRGRHTRCIVLSINRNPHNPHSNYELIISRNRSATTSQQQVHTSCPHPRLLLSSLDQLGGRCRNSYSLQLEISVDDFILT
jgi:hypothetical protein